MNTASPHANHNKSSSINQHNKQSTVPIVATNGLVPDQDKFTKPPVGDKVPIIGQHDIDNTNLTKLYESSTVVRKEDFTNSTCDLKMSPVEGPNVVLR